MDKMFLLIFSFVLLFVPLQAKPYWGKSSRGRFYRPGTSSKSKAPSGCTNYNIQETLIREGFTVRKNTAQYKGSSYKNVVHVERNITLEQAFDIAENNPDIDYFVYLKGYQMVLEIPSDVNFDPSKDPFHLVSYSNIMYDSGQFDTRYCRIFRHGDVVFFKKEGMWLGSAPGLADTYIKEKNISE